MMRFLTVNRVDSFTTLTVSSGATSKASLYDRTFSTQWQSVGSSDVVTETIEVIWPGVVTMDRISVLGHNLKEFNVQYWDGGGYVDFSTPINETVNTTTDNFYSFNSVSTLKIKLSATKTIIANAQKQIGELLAYQEHFSISDDDMPDQENPIAHFRQTEHEKVNGGSVIVIESLTSKYQNTFSFNNVPKTTRDYIEWLKNQNASFWFMPDDSEVEDQYYCNMINFNFRKILAFTVAGERCYAGSFEVKET
jgi:hypothetical protein